MSDFQGSMPIKVTSADSLSTLIIDTNGAAHVTGTMTLAGNQTIAITSGTNTLTIDSNGAIPVSSVGGTVNVAGAVSVTNTVAVSGTVSLASNTSVTVSATDLDIRALTAAKDKVSIGSGSNTLAIASDGSLSVNVLPAAETTVSAYGASSNDIAKNGTFTFDYAITSAKTFKGKSVVLGSSGATKVTVGLWDGTTFVPKRTFFQQPSVNPAMPIEGLSLLGNGTSTIRVIATNLDSATTLYCSIDGSER